MCEFPYIRLPLIGFRSEQALRMKTVIDSMVQSPAYTSYQLFIYAVTIFNNMI